MSIIVMREPQGLHYSLVWRFADEWENVTRLQSIVVDHFLKTGFALKTVAFAVNRNARNKKARCLPANTSSTVRMRPTGVITSHGASESRFLAQLCLCSSILAAPLMSIKKRVWLNEDRVADLIFLRQTRPTFEARA